MKTSCKYCGISNSKFVGRRFSAHVRHCKMNPNNAEIGKKISHTIQNKKINIVIECPHCKIKFNLRLTKNAYNLGKHRKYCSRSCANVRVHSKETKRKISRTNCIVMNIFEIKSKLINGLKKHYSIPENRERQRKVYRKWQKDNPKEFEEARKKSSIINSGKILSESHKEKLRLANLGRALKHKKRVPYKNTIMRSTWEVLTAKFLDAKGIKWQYEPKRFYFNDFTYLPDFYLPESDIWVEVKGWMNKRSARQIEAFRKLGKCIVVLEENEIKIIKGSIA